MKVFVDTNVLFSSFINPNGGAAKAFLKAVSGENEAVICRQNIEELKATIAKKYPTKIESLKTYLQFLSAIVEVVEMPKFTVKSESMIRDSKDRPLLRAAVVANVDVIVTGDKDFLEAGIEFPPIMSPAQFLSYDVTPPDDPLYVAEP